MFKNSDKKCCAYISMFYMLAELFREQTDIFYVVRKSTKFSAKIIFSRNISFSFFTLDIKSVFHEICSAHVEFQCVGADALFGFFF
jgi:hypothetical protein